MKGKLFSSLLLFMALQLCCDAEPAKSFTVHKIFSDHMVLQREKPIRIFGFATPGDSVTVSFAGAQRVATADAAGKWLAEFPALKAGTGYSVEVAGANPQDRVAFVDVAVGEVWLCSGQSNMNMAVSSANNAEAEVKNANYPGIREFIVPVFSQIGKESKDLKSGLWLECNTENAGRFSALSYFFARQLYKDMKIPIGIIHSSLGATNILAWMPQESFVPAGELLAVEDIREAEVLFGDCNPKEMQRVFDAKLKPWIENFNKAASEKSKESESWKDHDLDDSSWGALPQSQSNSEHVPQVVWYRNVITDVPAEYAKSELTLTLPSIVGTSEVYLNGKLVGKTDVLKPMHRMWKTRSFKVPTLTVVPGKNVIAIRLCDYGTGVTKFNDADCTRLFCGGTSRLADAKNWKMKTEYVADIAQIEKCPTLYDVRFISPNFPGALFNGMIAPLTDYPVCGVLWYQGEGDAYSPSSYYQRNRELIKSWRERWHNPAMPFIITQLAGNQCHSPKSRLPDDFWKKLTPDNNDMKEWKVLREVQGEIGKLPNAGLITAIDIGDHSDVHPKDKQTLGFRAAKEAERLAYGYDIVSRGPTYRSMKVEGDKIRISFDNVGGGLATKDGKAPSAFAIAGKDGKFVWADATIDGGTVVVSSSQIAEPVNVRYAWISFRPDLNLCNKEGFPAFPFRTDSPEYR